MSDMLISAILMDLRLQKWTSCQLVIQHRTTHMLSLLALQVNHQEQKNPFKLLETGHNKVAGVYLRDVFSGLGLILPSCITKLCPEPK